MASPIETPGVIVTSATPDESTDTVIPVPTKLIVDAEPTSVPPD